MTPVRWQLLTSQIISVLGVLVLGVFAVSAGPLVEHWHPRELMRALSISCTLGLVGLFASAWLLHKHPELRSSQSVMVLVCGVALTGVQIIAIWTVVLPTVGY
jgi:H+/Cl- antiporter ClcA